MKHSDTNKYLSVHSEEGQNALGRAVIDIQTNLDHRRFETAQIVALASLINQVSILASQAERLGDLLEAQQGENQ